MGNAFGGVAHEGVVELRSPEEVVGGRARLSTVFPWTDLVGRAADMMVAERCRRGNSSFTHWAPSAEEAIGVLERAEPRIRALTEVRVEFPQNCPVGDGPAEWQRYSAMVPVDWAKALLEQMPELRATRHRFVPSRISEEAFWGRYFKAVFTILEVELQDLAETVERSGTNKDAEANFPLSESALSSTPPPRFLEHAHTHTD
eukprot:TRINITY_DN30060_c0_g1_i1.p1 TRINITY_DN30060_c0_g1~~TRINITY_DN30060_c0_g1_i1.p1  ORF type:complete len:202 (-),score=30.37 TRINITY_DN30060_c0_g1_i1:4-609(-)